MQRVLGNTGVAVFPIGLGGMPLSIQNRPEEETAIEVIRTALESGVNFIDSADVYCLDDHDIGHNERLIAKALREIRPEQEVYVATKGGLRRPGGDWVTDARPERLRDACEKSLKALHVEQIFLYQLHAVDDRVPLEDSVGELAKLKKEGKVAHLGLSNASVEHLERAQKITRIETVQNRCNILQARDLQAGLVAACRRHQVTFIAHSPVGGWGGHQRAMQQKTLHTIATKNGVSAYQVALAWLLAAGENILPIPGASRVESIRDSAKAADLRLSREDIAQLSEASASSRAGF